LVAPLLGLAGGSSACEVRSEAASTDAYFQVYWRWMAWSISTLLVGGAGVGFVVLSGRTHMPHLARPGFLCFVATAGSALVAVLFGVRLNLVKNQRARETYKKFIEVISARYAGEM
jgi:hypothetical protein